MNGRSAAATLAQHAHALATRNAAKTRQKKRYGAKSIGSFVPGLTQKAFESYGFPAAALLMDWDNIVGSDLAAFTQPQKVKWPRMKDVDLTQFDDLDQPPEIASYRDLSGATLVVRVDGARALELQHRAPQMIERINQYFGYRAIVELRIVQAPITVNVDMPFASPFTGNARSQSPREALPQDKRAQYGLDRVQNSALKATLEDMAAGLQARSSRTSRTARR